MIVRSLRRVSGDVFLLLAVVLPYLLLYAFWTVVYTIFMTRKTILLVFGGESSEHDVSISSARNIYAALDGEKYDTLLGYIDRRGKWWLLDEWSD